MLFCFFPLTISPLPLPVQEIKQLTFFSPSSNPRNAHKLIRSVYRLQLTGQYQQASETINMEANNVTVPVIADANSVDEEQDKQFIFQSFEPMIHPKHPWHAYVHIRAVDKRHQLSRLASDIAPHDDTFVVHGYLEHDIDVMDFIDPFPFCSLYMDEDAPEPTVTRVRLAGPIEPTSEDDLLLRRRRRHGVKMLILPISSNGRERVVLLDCGHFSLEGFTDVHKADRITYELFNTAEYKIQDAFWKRVTRDCRSLKDQLESLSRRQIGMLLTNIPRIQQPHTHP
jgi:hypothetical protein